MNELVLVAGTSQKLHVSFEYSHAANSKETIQQVESQKYSVIIISSEHILKSEVLKALQNRQLNYPYPNIILIDTTTLKQEQIHQITSTLILHDVLTDWHGDQLSDSVYSALEKTALQGQEKDLETLVQTQTEKLKTAYSELEERIDKRQNFLLESRKKIHTSHVKWETLRQALLLIHKAKTINEIEMSLLEFLQPQLNLQMIRIHLRNQAFIKPSNKETKDGFRVFQARLYEADEQIGTVSYFRSNAFTKDETELLQKVADGLSLAMNRLLKLEHAENLRAQWEITFDSISDPTVLINQNYEIVQSNASFRQSKSPEDSKRKCYEALFQRTEPCADCHRGQAFRLEANKQRPQSYDVYSQSVKVDHHQDMHYFHIYHDVSEQLKMERKILESARLAEIGTIGSSIAHELNNPLAGMLSYVQLIKMDLDVQSELFNDIKDMEDGIKRCRDIIENLLGFTRDASMDQEREIDLRDIIQRTQKIVELQTKSWGIDLKVILPARACMITAHVNLLSQAIRNILNNSIENLKLKTKEQSGFLPQIEVRLNESEKEYEILILDNSPGLQHMGQLSLSIAAQIIHDYGGELQYQKSASRSNRSSSKVSVAKITLPRPVLQA